MSKLDLTNRMSRWFPPVWIVGAILLYMVLAGIVAFILETVFGLTEAGIDVFVVPIAEEALKLWLVAKLSQRAFGAIVTFAFLEVLLVKIPLGFSLSDDAGLLLVGSAIAIPFLFHVCTALAYRMAHLERFYSVVFAVCLAFHILFNSLSVVGLSNYQWTASAIAICSVVAGSGWLLGIRGRGSRSLDH